MAKIGEVYSTSQNSERPYILQFVARDMTQLNSDVMAIWKMSAEAWQSYSCSRERFSRLGTMWYVLENGSPE